MSTRKTIHLVLDGAMVEAVDARRVAASKVEGERVSMVKAIRRLIRLGLLSDAACAGGAPQ